jgi:hypothetical protein
MNRKNLVSIILGIALGLLLAWWMGLFASNPPVTQTAVATMSPPASPAKPILVTTVAHADVAMPTAPAVAAHQADALPATTNSSQSKPQAPTTADSANFAQVRAQSQRKAITNNLRILATAAQQYMLDKGVTSAGYYDLVGTGTDNYVRGITPVIGEDYTGIYLHADDTQVTLVAPDGTTVTYNM